MTTKRLNDASQAIQDCLIIDTLRSKLRELAHTEENTDEENAALATDILAFHEAEESGDMTVIKTLALKYGTTTAPTPTPEPEPTPTPEPTPEPTPTPEPNDADAIADKVLEGLRSFLATDENDKPVKAASAGDLDALTTRVTNLENTNETWGFNTALIGGGITAVALMLIAVFFQVTVVRNTFDIAILMVIIYGAFGFIAGAAIGAIIGWLRRNNS